MEQIADNLYDQLGAIYSDIKFIIPIIEKAKEKFINCHVLNNEEKNMILNVIREFSDIVHKSLCMSNVVLPKYEGCLDIVKKGDNVSICFTKEHEKVTKILLNIQKIINRLKDVDNIFRSKTTLFCKIIFGYSSIFDKEYQQKNITIEKLLIPDNTQEYRILDLSKKIELLENLRELCLSL